VWHGLGRFRFQPEGQRVELRLADGSASFALDRYGLSFVDANRDGLTDALLSSDAGARLYLNHSDALVDAETKWLEQPRTPELFQLSQRECDTVALAGVPWRRRRRLVQGFGKAASTERSEERSVVTTTHFERDAAGVCPVAQRQQSLHGELLRTQELADIEPLREGLHSTVGDEALRGTHANATYDFHLVQRVRRNELGQVTAIVRVDGNTGLLVQTRRRRRASPADPQRAGAERDPPELRPAHVPTAERDRAGRRARQRNGH
jgi:hypothetical protein